LGSLNLKVDDDLPLLASQVSKLRPRTHRQAYGLAEETRQRAQC
jgi:hypothetical protein